MTSARSATRPTRDSTYPGASWKSDAYPCSTIIRARRSGSIRSRWCGCSASLRSFSIVDSASKQSVVIPSYASAPLRPASAHAQEIATAQARETPSHQRYQQDGKITLLYTTYPVASAFSNSSANSSFFAIAASAPTGSSIACGTFWSPNSSSICSSVRPLVSG